MVVILLLRGHHMATDFSSDLYNRCCCHNNSVCTTKGELISEGFLLVLKSKKEGAQSFSRALYTYRKSAQESDMAPFFEV